MENFEIEIDYLDLFTAPIQMSKLDIDIDSLTEFCYEMKHKDKDGVKISNFGGWQSKNIVDETHQEFEKLKKHIDRATEIYKHEIEFVNRILHTGNIWVNLNKKGSYNEWHTHPYSTFSGCFYLNVTTPIVFRHPYSEITTFYWNPENIKNWNAVNSGEWKLAPKPNTLLIFPSWLEHKVDLNPEDIDRITISFNVQFV